MPVDYGYPGCSFCVRNTMQSRSNKTREEGKPKSGAQDGLCPSLGATLVVCHPASSNFAYSWQSHLQHCLRIAGLST